MKKTFTILHTNEVIAKLFKYVPPPLTGGG